MLRLHTSLDWKAGLRYKENILCALVWNMVCESHTWLWFSESLSMDLAGNWTQLGVGRWGLSDYRLLVVFSVMAAWLLCKKRKHLVEGTLASWLGKCSLLCTYPTFTTPIRHQTNNTAKSWTVNLQTCESQWSPSFLNSSSWVFVMQ